MTTAITLECHELMGRDPKVRQPWSDVSVSFIREPGGITQRFEPTLISLVCLKDDLALVRSRLQSQSARADDSELVERLASIVNVLSNDAQFHTESKSPEDKNPEIYTSSPYIDQAEAERMLSHFLGTRGVTQIAFQWVWPEFVCSVG